MKIRFYFALFLLPVLFLQCSLFEQKPVTLYISPAGNDKWSGKIESPNDEGTDGPFATFGRARDAVRSFKTENRNISVLIRVKHGAYPFAETLQFDSLDSGSEKSPVVWQSFSDSEVVIFGGKKLSDFEKVSDPKIIDRLPAATRNHVVQVDLKAIGISDYGHITQRGGPGLELFFNGKRMTIARFPNEGWLKIADVPQFGKKLYHKGLEREKRFDGVPVGRHYGRIKFAADKPLNWSSENEIFVHGYWTWDWSDSYQKVEKIDFRRNEITLAEPHHNYGYTKNQRFYFLNVLEELDSPGEWYLDRQNGVLYFWPPASPENADAFVSVLDSPLIALTNCSNIRFENFSFKYSRGSGVVINGGSDNLIAGCDFSFLGDNAVVINGGRNNGITSSDIHDVAMSGIILGGGDRKTLTPGYNFAANNHIHHYSNWVRTWQLAINLSGVGNYVANNVIHDAPHEGMYVHGNEHVLEFNEIFNVCNETGDAGAIHTGRNYTWRGNEYRYNYFHHLKGPGLHGVTAIYLDDFTSDYKIYGNICYKSGRGTLIGGGRDNLIQNNVYIDCHPSILLDARGLSWASYYFDGTYPVLFDSMKAMNATAPPYSEKYPELLTVADDQPAVPKNNRILNNISYGGRFLELYDFFAYDFSVVTLKNNVIADSIICKRIKEKPEGWEPYYLNLDNESGYNYYTTVEEDIQDIFKDNFVLKENPGFLDVEKEDFRLKKNSPAFEAGFKEIPVEKIGLYSDDYRKTLPQYR